MTTAAGLPHDRMTSMALHFIRHIKQHFGIALTAAIAIAGCSAAPPEGVTEQPVASPASSSEVEVVTDEIGEIQVYDSVEALMGDSFVVLSGTVKSMDPKRSELSISVDEVWSDVSAYADNVSPPPIVKGNEESIRLIGDEVDYVTVEGGERALIFLAYSDIGWWAVGRSRGVYAIRDGILSGAKAAPLNGMKIDEVGSKIRSLGVEDALKLEADRKDRTSIAALMALPLVDVEALPPLRVKVVPPEPELGAHLVITAAAPVLGLWCRAPADDPKLPTLSESCLLMAPFNSSDTVDGAYAALVPVPLRPPSAVAADDTCESGGCFALFVDLSQLTVTRVDPALKRYDGPSGQPDAPVALPTADVPVTERLSVELVDIGRSSDGEKIVLVTLDDASTRAAYASWCSGPVDSVEACNVPSAQLLFPLASGSFANFLSVPSDCKESCRVIVVDVADFGRRTTVSV
jgi:transcription antitermination factor NusG